MDLKDTGPGAPDPSGPWAEPLINATVNISCPQLSQMTTKRYKTTPKRWKMTSEKHKRTTRKPKTASKKRNTTTKTQNEKIEMQDSKEMLKKTQNDSTKTVMSERCKAVIKIHKMTPNKYKLITLKQGCS